MCHVHAYICFEIKITSLLVYYRPYNYERMLNAIANKSKI